jgi:large subunit ribosomal protein L21
MYAIIRSGSRQYRAEAGQLLRVEKLEKKLGEQFDMDQVLFVGGDKAAVGNPLVKGAKVTVVVTQQTRDDKILVFKKKRRHGYRRTQGHRQPFTELFIVAISANGETAKADSKPVVIDPAKKAERIAKFAALPKAERKAKAVQKAQKKVAKKAAGVKKATKKTAAKKKKAVKKKTTKKK